MGKRIRSLKYLVNRYLLKKPFLIAESDFGHKFLFKTEDCIGRHIYKYGIYEKPVTEVIVSIPFESGDVVIDVGANIGWYSVLIDALSPPNVKIYAFEPEPLNFKLLKENLKLNKASKVIPIRKALGEKRGIVKMFLYPTKNSGRHSLIPMYNYGSVSVEMITLDDFAKENEINKIKLLKIDVEGYEYMVLKGAENIIESIDFIILEMVPDYMKKGEISIDEFVSFIASLKFKTFIITENGLEEVNPESLIHINKDINLFLQRRDPSLSLSSLLTS